MSKIKFYIVLIGFFFPILAHSQEALTRDQKFKLAHKSISEGNLVQSYSFAEAVYQEDLLNNDTNNIIEDLFLLSKVNRSISLPSISLQNIFKIRDFKNTGDSLLEQRIKLEISYLAEEVGALELALKYRLECYQKEINKKPSSHRFYFEGSIGSLYIKTNQTSNSLSFFQQQLKTAFELSDEELKIQAQNNIGFYYQKLRQLDSAKITYKNIIENHPDTSRYSYHNTCGNLALIYRDLDSFEMAIKNLKVDYNYLISNEKASITAGLGLIRLYNKSNSIEKINQIYDQIDSKRFNSPINLILEYENKPRSISKKVTYQVSISKN